MSRLHDLADFLRQTGQLERRQPGQAVTRAAFEIALNKLDREMTDDERTVAMIMFNAGMRCALAHLVPDQPTRKEAA